MLTQEHIKELEDKIGYCFKDKNLLKQALTHSSFVNEQRINKLPDYERLEFLGDAVLQLTTSDLLFRNYPEMREGELTRYLHETDRILCAWHHPFTIYVRSRFCRRAASRN